MSAVYSCASISCSGHFCTAVVGCISRIHPKPLIFILLQNDIFIISFLQSYKSFPNIFPQKISKYNIFFVTQTPILHPQSPFEFFVNFESFDVQKKHPSKVSSEARNNFRIISPFSPLFAIQKPFSCYFVNFEFFDVKKIDFFDVKKQVFRCSKNSRNQKTTLSTSKPHPSKVSSEARNKFRIISPFSSISQSPKKLFVFFR